jgi:sterol desaturase/sphingolipid hydroxylase (fatty acid hydroxylase superfamily)
LSNNVITFLLQISAVFAVVLSYSPSSSYFISLPIVAQALLGVLILDFGIWVWHRLNHIMPFLWVFHKCHHTETYLNASSALRFHIGELLLSVVWKSLILILIGIPLWVFLLSEFLLTLFALFHHANIKLSEKTRIWLELLIITPYLHRVHHSEIRSEHDTNYGVILSLWDRIFGTLHTVVPHKIGLKNVSDKNIITFLLFPFHKK